MISDYVVSCENVDVCKYFPSLLISILNVLLRNKKWRQQWTWRKYYNTKKCLRDYQKGWALEALYGASSLIFVFAPVSGRSIVLGWGGRHLGELSSSSFLSASFPDQRAGAGGFIPVEVQAKWRVLLRNSYLQTKYIGCMYDSLTTCRSIWLILEIWYYHMWISIPSYILPHWD